MAQTEEYITLLWERYLSNKASLEEVEELYHFSKDSLHDEQNYEYARVAEAKLHFSNSVLIEPPELLLEQILHNRSAHRVHFLKTSWFRYAAAIIIVLGTAAYFWFNYKELGSNRKMLSKASIEYKVSTDIASGTNKATLTIGNNNVIDLASTKKGITVGSFITYTDGEKIADIGQQLELTTPRGGQYQAVLPDGSTVWLNAASSIKFPSKFTGNQRSVEIRGEVYLEIAKNSGQPFVVHTNKATIEVLGTNFNINAYEDEAGLRTTLLDGSIKVTAGAKAILLQPGQQAQVINNQIQVLKKIDLEQVIAWKNGLFRFTDTNIKEIMRQAARWYDVDIIYEGNVDELNFSGFISRKQNIAELLRLLEATGLVHFKIEGRKVTVTK